MAAAATGARAGLAAACLVLAACALALAGRLPVGVRTQVLVRSFSILHSHALRAVLQVGALGAVRPRTGARGDASGVCSQLGSAVHASHAAHRASHGTGAELTHYDNILTLPKLGANGQREVGIACLSPRQYAVWYGVHAHQSLHTATSGPSWRHRVRGAGSCDAQRSLA